MVLENVVFCPTHFVSGPKQFDKECRYDVSGVRDSHGQCPVTSSDGKQLGTGTTEREREREGAFPPGETIAIIATAARATTTTHRV